MRIEHSVRVEVGGSSIKFKVWFIDRRWTDIKPLKISIEVLYENVRKLSCMFSDFDYLIYDVLL